MPRPVVTGDELSQKLPECLARFRRNALPYLRSNLLRKLEAVHSSLILRNPDSGRVTGNPSIIPVREELPTNLPDPALL
jgi:hypothetical protein